MYPMTNLSVSNPTNENQDAGGYLFPKNSTNVTVTTYGHRVSEIAGREALAVTNLDTGERL
jgi:hypothetical protein